MFVLNYIAITHETTGAFLFLLLFVIVLLLLTSSRGTADTEIEVFSAENRERLGVLPLKPGVDQNVNMQAPPTTSNCFLFDPYITSSPFKFISSRPLPRFYPCVRCG